MEKDIFPEKIFENKEEKIHLGLLELLENVIQQIFDLKKNPDICNSLDYKKFIFCINDFFNKLSDYYEIKNNYGCKRGELYQNGQLLTQEERDDLKATVESLDLRQKYLHDNLMEDYFNIIYYYKKLFIKDQKFTFPLETFFFDEKGIPLPDYSKYDSKGNISLDIESIDNSTRNKFSEYFFREYQKIEDVDEEQKSIFKNFLNDIQKL